MEIGLFARDGSGSPLMHIHYNIGSGLNRLIINKLGNQTIPHSQTTGFGFSITNFCIDKYFYIMVMLFLNGTRADQ